MDCGIQLGHGMRSCTLELVKSWNDNTRVMLGPRNFNFKGNSGEDKLISYSSKLKKTGARIFIDPQLFSCKEPQKNLAHFSHCIACNQDLRKNYTKVIDSLIDLNARATTDALILPSNTFETVTQNWIDLQQRIVDYAYDKALEPLYSTIALSSSALRDETSIDMIVDTMAELPVRGVYFVCEHPSSQYLTDDTLWLLNYMVLVAALRLRGIEVFVGYASHQQLCLVLTLCTAIFTGNYLNMRHFRQSTFEKEDEDSPSRHSRWYYAPHLLSEFRVVTLDVAHRRGLLNHLIAPSGIDRHSASLFLGGMPSETAYNDRNSFMHYIDSIHNQCQYFSRSTYEESLETYLASLRTAGEIVSALRKEGIYDGNRSYLNAVEASESAVRAFNGEMGFNMEMSWGS